MAEIRFQPWGGWTVPEHAPKTQAALQAGLAYLGRTASGGYVRLHTALPRGRILVVEDEAHLANGLRFNLEAEGYQVLVVETGEKALEQLLKPNEIELVVLDVMLPGKDGFTVISEIRHAGQYVPTLMLTARGRADLGSARIRRGGGQKLGGVSRQCGRGSPTSRDRRRAQRGGERSEEEGAVLAAEQ